MGSCGGPAKPTTERQGKDAKPTTERQGKEDRDGQRGRRRGATSDRAKRDVVVWRLLLPTRAIRHGAARAPAKLDERAGWQGESAEHGAQHRHRHHDPPSTHTTHSSPTPRAHRGGPRSWRCSVALTFVPPTRASMRSTHGRAKLEPTQPRMAPGTSTATTIPTSDTATRE